MTLYHWRRTGYGPQGTRVGRYVRYRPEEVRAWFESRAARRARCRDHRYPSAPTATSARIECRGGYRALTRFRDHDGVTRKVERRGHHGRGQESAARALRDRAPPGPTTGSPGTRDSGSPPTSGSVGRPAGRTGAPFAEHGAVVPAESHDPCTAGHRGNSASRADGPSARSNSCRRSSSTAGTATAKIARTVVSGVLGLAVRHGAIPVNPARDVGRHHGHSHASAPGADRRRSGRSGSPVCERTRMQLRKDLPDLCEWMLGTGVRIGEALAVSWEDVDLTAELVAIEHTIVRIKGVGLVRKGTKSSAGERTLRPAVLRASRCCAGASSSRGDAAQSSRTRAAAGVILPTPAGICATRAGSERVRLGDEPRVPQDRGHGDGPCRALRAADRRSARAREDLDDAGPLPRSAGGRRRCCRRCSTGLTGRREGPRQAFPVRKRTMILGRSGDIGR